MDHHAILARGFSRVTARRAAEGSAGAADGAASDVAFGRLTAARDVARRDRARRTRSVRANITKSKISVGIAIVQRAFGISTMPLIRPSTGAVPTIMYACSPVYPNFFRYFRQARR